MKGGYMTIAVTLGAANFPIAVVCHVRSRSIAPVANSMLSEKGLSFLQWFCSEATALSEGVGSLVNGALLVWVHQFIGGKGRIFLHLSLVHSD